MKTSSTLLLIFFTCIIATVNATNYTNNGNTQPYALNSGDTLKIVSGIYAGNINSFQNGAVITVSSGATFKPNNFNIPQGKIINYGTCEFNSLGTYSNFKFDNYNLLVVKNDLTLNDGTTQTWNNHYAATIKVTGSFAMNNAVFTNYATMSIGINFAMYAATSNYINRGMLTINGDISITNGILDNENRIVVDDLNAWGGQVINEGEIMPKGDMTFSNGTTYTNRCLLVTGEGFTNYGTFTNNGLLWVGRTGTTNDHFYNSGTFTNAAGATVRTVRFTNYNTLTGAGNYYITGESYTSGTVGRSGSTTDTITVYDVTRSNASRIFDTQWGTVHPNVVYRVFQQPDTNKVNYAGCSSFYRSSLANPLPIVWESFDARLQNGKPLLTWSANYEADSRFDVQRSFDNVNYVKVNTQIATTGSQYTHTDNSLEKATVVYYRVKATSRTGAVTYTETKNIRLGNDSKAELSVYPNPANNQATIQFTTQRNELVTIDVNHITGQSITSYTVKANSGINTFSIPNVSGLQKGVYLITLKNETDNISTCRFVKN